MPIKITMPALSPTMTEGKLAKWHKKEGDTVKAGDVLAEIETDKATMEVEAVDEGTLGKILVPEGTENVQVNTVIALLLAEGEDASAVAGVSAGPAAPAARPAAPAPAPAAPKPAAAPAAAKVPPAPIAASADSGERAFVSPLARRMAQQAGLNLSVIQGSGPHGRIVKADIEAAMTGGAGRSAAVRAPAPAMRPSAAPAARGDGAYTDTPVSSIRKVIAKRLTEVQQNFPVFYLTVDCEIDRLLAARQEINEAAPKDKASGQPAYKVSVNDLVIKAAACALLKIPSVNASWHESVIREYHTVDISVAVATERGLITPIVWNVDQKGVGQIANDMKELAAKARAGKLKPEEFQGGGFSVSNLGMYGMRHFTSIINPPQAAILAVGAGEQRPVVRNGKLEVATVMSVTLTCDHRVVDGATGAEWVQAFKKFIEQPATMLA
ncbi:MAG: pyruvate dehydrogenase complex dihydrolipoamide acetyltransferase [Alphaproteobacteria bacterium]